MTQSDVMPVNTLGGNFMNLYDTHTMKRGAILVDVCGYTGEEDFYAMHKIIDEVIKPEDSGFSVDSMCIGGYFNKDGKAKVKLNGETFFIDVKGNRVE